MTTLTKLGIQGIRSFSNERMESLEFERPVTLIVGHNGAGKTTIIECLKMYVLFCMLVQIFRRATCGQLPPNCDKGHGFIHDPNVAGVPEVKGQIRLLFRTGVNHQSVCATRTFQLTNTRSKAGIKSTFKAVENLIRFKDRDGDNNRGNRKCNDMDSAIPSLMGVSRPILEHVIFCHQEDSNWPLGERILLKKRFDEIFGSSRYTKALDAIDKQKKEIIKEAKEKAHVLALVAKDRDTAAELVRDKDRLSRSIDSLVMRIAELSSHVDLKEQELTGLQKTELEFREKLIRIESVGAEIERVKSERFGIENERLTVESCRRDLDESNQHMSELDQRKIEISKNWMEAKSAFESVASQRTQAAGKLKALRNSHVEASNIHDLLRLKRGELVDAIAAAKTQQFLPTTFEDSPNAIAEMERFVQERSGHMTTVCRESTAKIHAVEAVVNQAETERSRLQRNLFQFDSEIAILDSKISSGLAEVRAAEERMRAIIGVDGVWDFTDSESVRRQGLEVLQARISELEKQLEALAVQRRIYLSKNADVVKDIRSEVLEMVSDSVTVASLMHAGPNEIVSFLETKLATLTEKLTAVLTTVNTLLCASCTQDNGAVGEDESELDLVKDELSLARRAMTVYNQLKTRTVTDSKCGLCRQRISSIPDFELLFEKMTKRLPEIIAENEQKLSAISSGGPRPTVASDSHTATGVASGEKVYSELKRIFSEIVATEKAISKVRAFQDVIARLDARTVDTDDMVDPEIELARIELEESKLNAEKNKSLFDMDSFSTLVDRRVDLIGSVCEFEQRSAAMRKDGLTDLNAKIEVESTKIGAAKAELGILTESFRKEQSELDSQLNAMRVAFHGIFQIKTQIDGIQSRVTAAPADHHQTETTSLEILEAELGVKLTESMAAMNAHDAARCEIEATIKTALSTVEAAIVRLRFAELVDLLTNLKSEVSGCPVPPDRISASISGLSLQLRSLRDERSKLEGECTQVKLQRTEVEKRLNSPSLVDVDEKYRQAFCLMENHSLLSRDVQRYHQALDRALMNYHVEKMNEINQGVRELWEKVYKGSDIDFIALRSDSESEEAAEAATRRSYNYRVMMVKGDVELEMRGRCSAGQKVLASLIIRLALAESFCASCGILALDEPTTNLDRSNIGGLAQALADLIESRRQQRNFQLIVITHDESFVRMLGRLRACENFYRVSKDDNGHSTIARAAIYELNTR